MQIGRALTEPAGGHLALTFRLNYTQGTNSAFVGFTTAASGMASTEAAQQFGLVIGAGVGLCKAGTCTALVPTASLAPGLYDFTLMLPGDGTAVISIVSGDPVTTEGKAFRVPYTVPSALNNVELETNATADLFATFGSVEDDSEDSPTYPIPHRQGYTNGAIMIPLPLTAGGSKTTAYAWIPPNYVTGTQNKWVLAAHGFGETGQMITQQYNANSQRLGTFLMQNGFVTVTVDNTRQNCWGNEQCVTDFQTAMRTAQAAFSLESEPYFLGDSMGGLQLLNTIAKGVIKPKVLVGACITTNLNWTYFKQNQGASPSIQAAFDFTTDDGYATATAGYDPQVTASTPGEGQANLAAVPMLLFSSPQDKSVVRRFNATLFAKTLNAAGGQVTVFSSNGGHEDPSNFPGDLIVNFFLQH